jgi:hypothetical protein
MAPANEMAAGASTVTTASTTMALDGLRSRTPSPLSVTLPLCIFVVYVLGSCKHCKSRTWTLQCTLIWWLWMSMDPTGAALLGTTWVSS